MRKPLVAGNWKMNGTAARATELSGEIVTRVGAIEGADVAVCPPFVYLPAVAAATANSGVALGAQNLAAEAPGAFTGEVAGEMLVDVGCRMVLVGHSERRALYGETNELVASKFARALEVGLTPILCVGETLEDREGDRTEEVVEAQIGAVLDGVGVDGVTRGIVAYEPVWAIGTGRTASPDQANAVHEFIRRRIGAADAEAADGLRILYGGSVKADNAADLFARPDIDGGLIGGASLSADDFVAICEAAD